MKKLHFHHYFLAYLFLLLIVLAVCFSGVVSILREYEASQPERLTETFARQISAYQYEDNFRELLDIPPELDADFTEGSTYYSEFRNAVQKKDLSWQQKPGTPDGSPVYVLKDGDTPLVELTLKCIGTETRLGFLTVSQFRVETAVPMYKTYEISLDDSFYLYVDGVQCERDESGSFLCRSLYEPTFSIGDRFGNVKAYSSDAKYELTEYTVKVPAWCTVSVGNVPLSVEEAEIAANPALAEAREFVSDLPDDAIYHLSVLSDATPDVSVTDADGTALSVIRDGTSFTADISVSADQIPEGVPVLEIAHTWSLFMTQDLGTSRDLYGYYKVGRYLIPKSYLDSVAYKWATNIDIHFINYHTLSDPPFLDDRIDNVIFYGEDCFSCDVHFIKHFVLDEGNDIRDPMNSTFTFVRQGQSWYLVSITEILGGDSDAD